MNLYSFEGDSVQIVKCLVLDENENRDEFEILASIKTQYDVCESMKIDIVFSNKPIVSFLFEKYENKWLYCEFFFTTNGKNSYARLSNSTETKLKKIRAQLFQRDFDLVIYDNCVIRCVLYLKSDPDRLNIYFITKKRLLEDFVKSLYNNYGEDWGFFETYFEDSGDIAYGEIHNDKLLKKKQRITFAGLRAKRFKVNAKKWVKENSEVELFYILSFSHKRFLKIGHTFNSIEFRLYKYLFPETYDERRKYGESLIDFNASYLVITDIAKSEIEGTKSGSFEKQVKSKFKNQRTKIPWLGTSTEILVPEVLPLLLEEVKISCRENRFWKF